eukprot:TRINITY_DN101079_c0_g1_i1.p1 TRINITY_DN101079_c0_g1~~TRINITY_DN101079_c0_g1_i1.p1  ORF type:complete len:730 (-),score=195.12 TRINITY_DN101079_c0_g1_i1:111-2129(-)
MESMEDAAVEELVLPLLPPDVPDGSEAFKKCKLINTKHPFCFFNLPLELGGGRFQVTLRPSATADIMCRLARILYTKAEAGATQEELKACRADLYKVIKDALASTNGGSADAAEEAQPKKRGPKAKGGADASEPADKEMPTKRSKVTDEEQLNEPPMPVGSPAAESEGGGALKKRGRPKGSLGSRKTAETLPGVSEEKPPTPAASPEEKADKQPPAKKVKVEQEKQEHPAGVVTTAGPLPEAPEGHEAWALCQLKPEIPSKAAHISYEYQAEHRKIHLFVSSKHLVGGNEEHLGRIARLIYMKAQTGATKLEVEYYKAALVNETNAFLGDANFAVGKKIYHLSKEDKEEHEKRYGEKTERPGGGGRAKRVESTSLVQQLKDSGRIHGAVEVSGRQGGKKNDTINGVYELHTERFGDRPAYKKFGVQKEKLQRFIFYSEKKKRWKISNELAEEAKHSAYAKSTSSKLPTDASLVWHVYASKEAGGYEEDKDVKCKPLSEVKEEKDEQDAVGKTTAKKEEVKEEKTEGKQPRKVAEVIDSDSDMVSDSDSDSSSGSDSDSSDADGGGKAPVTAKAPVASPRPASSPPPASAAVGPAKGLGKGKQGGKPHLLSPPSGSPLPMSARTAPPSASRPYMPRMGMVCAKMMARAGIRCDCHFALLKNCPGQTIVVGVED